MTTIDEQALRRLDQLLQQQLPGAAIKIQTLPRTPGLQLALLDPEFDDRDLSQAIKNKLMDDPPYWIFCWASGYGLAELLLNRHYSVQDKIVVDFGAGSGVVAIAAKLAGAKKVYACEIDPIGCEVTSLNAAINQVEVEVIRDLSQAKGCELLLAADVLYEAANHHFLDLFLQVAENVLVADSRLKQMPNSHYQFWQTLATTSFPDFHEALEFNQVNFYRGESAHPC